MSVCQANAAHTLSNEALAPSTAMTIVTYCDAMITAHMTSAPFEHDKRGPIQFDTAP